MYLQATWTSVNNPQAQGCATITQREIQMLQRLLTWLQEREFNNIVSTFTEAEKSLLTIVNREAATQADCYKAITDIQEDIKASTDREERAEKWLAVIPKI